VADQELETDVAYRLIEPALIEPERVTGISTSQNPFKVCLLAFILAKLIRRATSPPCTAKQTRFQ